MKRVFDILFARWLWDTGIPKMLFGVAAALIGVVLLLWVAVPWLWGFSWMGRVLLGLVVLYLASLLLQAALVGLTLVLTLWRERS